MKRYPMKELSRLAKVTLSDIKTGIREKMDLDDVDDIELAIEEIEAFVQSTEWNDFTKHSLWTMLSRAATDWVSGLDWWGSSVCLDLHLEKVARECSSWVVAIMNQLKLPEECTQRLIDLIVDKAASEVLRDLLTSSDRLDLLEAIDYFPQMLSVIESLVDRQLAKVMASQAN